MIRMRKFKKQGVRLRSRDQKRLMQLAPQQILYTFWDKFGETSNVLAKYAIFRVKSALLSTLICLCLFHLIPIYVREHGYFILCELRGHT